MPNNLWVWLLRVPHSQQGRGTSSRQLGHWSGSFEGGRVAEMDKEVAMEMDKEVDNEEWVIQGGRVAIVWVVGGWKSEEGNVGVSDQDWL